MGANGSKYIFILLLVLFILLRLNNMSTLLIQEEYEYYGPVHEEMTYNYGFPHPPIAFWSFLTSATLFGPSVFSMRLAPFVCSILIFILLYLITKEFFSKKTMIWSLILFTVSFGQIATSFLLDTDTVFLTFTLLLTLYAYLLYVKTPNRSTLLFLGFSLGLAALSKYSAVLIFPVLFITLFFEFNKTNNFLKSFFKTSNVLFWAGLMAILIFLIYVIVDFTFNYGFNFYASINRLLSSSSTTSTFILTLFNRFYRIFLTSFYISPFLLILSFLWFVRTRNYKNVFFIFLIFHVFVYFVLLNPFLDLHRYSIILIPALCILSADYLSRIKFNKSFYLVFLSFIFHFILFYFITILPNKLVSYNMPQKIIESILHLDFLFYLPTWGTAGPKLYLFSFLIMVIAVIYCFLLLFVLMFKNKKAKIVFISIFVGCLLSYNLFLGLDYTFNFASPDIDKIKSEMIDFALNNELSEPLGITHPAMGVYFYDKYITTFDFTKNYLISKKKNWPENEFLKQKAKNWIFTKIASNKNEQYLHVDNNAKTDEKVELLDNLIFKNNGTILYLDVPFTDKTGKQWQEIQNNCEVVQTFSDKGYLLGYIFAC